MTMHYVHSNDSEVNDATAQLKGLLGIGTSPASESPPPADDDEDDKELTAAANKTVANNRKKSKKKRDSRRTNQNQKKGKKRTDSSNRASENFAWSAFQSSPDASKLPIPAFSTPSSVPTNENEAASEPNTEAFSILLNASGSSEADHPEIANAPRAEDLEDQFIAEAKKRAAEEDALSQQHKNGEVLEEESRKETAAEVDSAKETPITTTDDVGTGETHGEESDAPQAVSKTGVNLAELAAAAKPESPPTTTVAPSNDSQAVRQPLPNNRGPMQHYPHPGFGHPYHPPPPPPPGYITIQVQVPPVLLPGRQMMVTSPAGYPVRVMVPESIPPGMVIPVHVPAGPPMHMMPPPSSHYGRYYPPR